MPDTANTPTPTSAPAVAPLDVLGVLKKLGHDELALFLPLLNAELTALQQPGVNVQAVIQESVKAKVEALAALPQAETIGIAGTAAAAQAQLNSLVINALTAHEGGSDKEEVKTPPAAADKTDGAEA